MIILCDDVGFAHSSSSEATNRITQPTFNYYFLVAATIDNNIPMTIYHPQLRIKCSSKAITATPAATNVQ